MTIFRKFSLFILFSKSRSCRRIWQSLSLSSWSLSASISSVSGFKFYFSLNVNKGAISIFNFFLAFMLTLFTVFNLYLYLWSEFTPLVPWPGAHLSLDSLSSSCSSSTLTHNYLIFYVHVEERPEKTDTENNLINQWMKGNLRARCQPSNSYST